MKKRPAILDVAIPNPSDADLPEGWALVPIKDISIINPRHPKGLDDSMPVSFAPMSALSEDGPAFLALEDRPYGEVRKGFTHFGEGDVLFAKITPCMENGKGAIATGLRNGFGCGTTELHVIRPLGGIDLLYLYRFLSQQSVRRDAKETFTSSAGQARVPTRFIEELEIPLSPLSEQKRIVAKVEELLARVNAARERLAEVHAILKRFRQSVLVAACSGRLTEDWRADNPFPELSSDATSTLFENSELPQIPESWRWVPVKDLVPKGGMFDGPFGSNLKSSDYTNHGVRVVRLENIGQLRFIEEKRTYISREKFGTLTRHTVRAGDIIFASFISDEVRACVLPKLQEETIAKADCFCLRPSEGFDRCYLTFQLVSQLTHDLLIGEIHGATRPRINTTQLKVVPLRICPLPEQREIVRRVDCLFTLADTIEKQVATGMARAEKLTQAILAKAFRGELAPQDLNDEPATILLERIRCNRETESSQLKVYCGKR
ncbi:MAG: restriction endonuclease subunit S [bacterium]